MSTEDEKEEKMKKIENTILKTIEYAKKKRIEHQRFEEVQEPIRCSKCGKTVFRYSTLPFKSVVCPDCKKDRMEKRGSSKIEILKTESSKKEHKETFSPKKTYEIIRTDAGIKVRKKETENDEQK